MHSEDHGTVLASVRLVRDLDRLVHGRRQVLHAVEEALDGVRVRLGEDLGEQFVRRDAVLQEGLAVGDVVCGRAASRGRGVRGQRAARPVDERGADVDSRVGACKVCNIALDNIIDCPE